MSSEHSLSGEQNTPLSGEQNTPLPQSAQQSAPPAVRDEQRPWTPEEQKKLDAICSRYGVPVLILFIILLLIAWGLPYDYRFLKFFMLMLAVLAFMPVIVCNSKFNGANTMIGYYAFGMRGPAIKLG